MLTQETLVEIHVLHRQGESIRVIAQKLNLSRNTESHRVSWRPQLLRE